MKDLIAATLRLALSDRTIREDSIQLQQNYVDREGIVRPKGRTLTCNLLVRDGRLFVFEIEFYAKVDDVANLADKVTLVRSYHQRTEVIGLLVAPGRDPRVPRACRKYGIILAR